MKNITQNQAPQIIGIGFILLALLLLFFRLRADNGNGGNGNGEVEGSISGPSAQIRAGSLDAATANILVANDGAVPFPYSVTTAITRIDGSHLYLVANRGTLEVGSSETVTSQFDIPNLPSPFSAGNDYRVRWRLWEQDSTNLLDDLELTVTAQ